MMSSPFVSGRSATMSSGGTFMGFFTEAYRG
jgi:hypothetical protein